MYPFGFSQSGAVISIIEHLKYALIYQTYKIGIYLTLG